MVVIFSTAGIILDRVHNENVSVKPIVLRSLRVLRIIRGTTYQAYYYPCSPIILAVTNIVLNF
jgi:hypothetical protein